MRENWKGLMVAKHFFGMTVGVLSNGIYDHFELDEPRLVLEKTDYLQVRWISYKGDDWCTDFCLETLVKHMEVGVVRVRKCFASTFAFSKVEICLG